MKGIVKPESSNCWKDDEEHDLSRFLGVAGPINFGNGYLMLVREEVEAERHFDFHRFLLLDNPFHLTQIAKLFTFKHKSVELCSSMVTDHEGKNLILPVNFEENEFGFLETVRSMLESLP